MIWCNVHQRPAHLCHDEEGHLVGGSILLPCRLVDLTDILEINYDEIC